MEGNYGIGLWWRPETPDNKTIGRLYSDDDRGLNIELYGLMEPTSTPVLHGYIKGKHITAFNNDLRNVYTNSGVPIYNFKPGILIENLLLPYDDAKFCKGFVIKLGGLGAWFGGRIPVAVRRTIPNKSPNKGILTYGNSITLLVDRKKGLTIKMEVFGNGRVHADTKVVGYLKEYFPVITVDSEQPLTAEDVNEITVLCTQYFAIGLGRLLPIMEIKTDDIHWPAVEKNKRFLMILMTGNKTTFNPQYYQYYEVTEEMFLETSTGRPEYFGYNETSGVLRKVFTNFFTHFEKYKPLFNAVLQEITNKDQYWESVFITNASGLEFYYGAKGETTVKMNPKVFKSKIKAALNKLSENEKTLFSNAMCWANNVSYNQKIKRLYNSVKPILQNILPPITDRTSNIYLYRNQLAHGRTIPRLEGPEFVATAVFSTLLCEILVLKELGFKDRQIAYMIKSNKGFTSKLGTLRSPISRPPTMPFGFKHSRALT